MYLLNDKEVVDEKNSNDSYSLFLTEHGGDAETDADGDQKSANQTCTVQSNSHNYTHTIIFILHCFVHGFIFSIPHCQC